MPRTLRVTLLALLVPLLGLAAPPDLVLKDLDGKPHNVKEYIGQGKWTIVMLWAHDCPICNAEVHQMTFFYDEHKDKDATVLGISIDGWAKKDLARAFVERHSVNFPNLIAEPEPKLIETLSARTFYGTPTFYFYKPDGTFMKQHVGALDQEQAERILVQLRKKGG